MAGELSKTQIDKLGERLKREDIVEGDLRLLDEYRRSFAGQYETVVGAIRSELALEPTGRPSKSTTSISEKLRRESIRLTQIQDISGCRLLVQDLAEQAQVVESLAKLFDNVTVVDRRKQPSNGYRAVHVVVKEQNKLVEIQIRTALQHLWAEQSEKLSDILDPAIKYGGGDEKIQRILTVTSDAVAKHEHTEAELQEVQALISANESRIAKLIQGSSKAEEEEKVAGLRKRVADLRKRLEVIQRRVIENRQELTKVLQYTIDHAATLTGDDDDISD